MTVKLHVNIDHVATLRQARGTNYPDPVQAAELAEEAGAHGITVHLREDRRHIQDGDVEALRDRVSTLLNLEMAATEEMLAFARRVRPDLVTLVPERREERTTEGGLDLRLPAVVDAVGRLAQAELPVSLFIDPDEAMIRRAAELGVRTVELHTGDFANATPAAMPSELARLSA
ncbi:MAG: pyridoxine 5'-phosphate synthase, partial [Myxococcota bacterium]